MEKKHLTIGKTAKLMNVTIKALRFYDKIGLLKPGYIDPETNYRYYRFDQLMSIDLIKAARNLDISPNALVPYFTEKNTDQLIGLMRNHKDMLEEKMKQLSKTIDQIETIEKHLEVSANTDKSGSIYLRDLPDRYAVIQSIQAEQNEEDLLLSFYHLNAALNRMNLTYLYEEGIIYTLDRDTLRPESIYACVLKEESSVDYRLLPGGRYVCTVFHKDNAEEQFTKLLEYVSDLGLKPQLIVQTELLTDFFAESPEYCEVQIRLVKL